MKVYKILPSGFASNSYILTADGKNAVIIDCAQPKVFDECKSRGLKACAVLLTHGHYDHIGGCARFVAEGVPVYCSAEEKQNMFGEEYLALSYSDIKKFDIAHTIADGQELSIAGIKIKVIATPGHTAGGVCYIAEDYLFTGDTLFCESVGRCDLPTGSPMQLIKSIKKLYALEGDYTVCCGHEEDTTLSHERKYNPYVRQENA